MRMNVPAASRMPVFTAAPLPLLYGWRSTRAPAAAASAPVASIDPSSTTRISRHGAAVASSRTTAPMDAASLKAGITTDVSAASAISHQFIHHTGPCDAPRTLEPRVAERARQRLVGGDASNRG